MSDGKRGGIDQLLARLDDPAMREVAAVGAEFIRSQLRRPSAATPQVATFEGQWRDGEGLVHAVNSLHIAGHEFIDLGRETACETTFWSPDEPGNYPRLVGDDVDCMACLARGALG